jgi:hypothetical protein
MAGVRASLRNQAVGFGTPIGRLNSVETVVPFVMSELRRSPVDILVKRMALSRKLWIHIENTVSTCFYVTGTCYLRQSRALAALSLRTQQSGIASTSQKIAELRKKHRHCLIARSFHLQWKPQNCQITFDVGPSTDDGR